MIAPKDNTISTPSRLAVVEIGNSSITAGLWSGDRVQERQVFALGALEELGAALKAFAAEGEGGFLSGVAIASVVPETLARLCAWIEDELTLEPLVVGDQIPLPIHAALDAPEAVGVDRVCNAAAAYDKNKQSCVVVDCGSAITVDVVDDEGCFIGGAIYPGLRMQARALHEHTALLPEVTPGAPDAAIGEDTESAIRTGLYHGTAGAIRGIIEAYATQLGRWPVVIGTGGDIELIARECDIFDALVQDLCLIGVGLAYDRRLNQAVSL